MIDIPSLPSMIEKIGTLPSKTKPNKRSLKNANHFINLLVPLLYRSIVYNFFSLRSITVHVRKINLESIQIESSHGVPLSFFVFPPLIFSPLPPPPFVPRLLTSEVRYPRGCRTSQLHFTAESFNTQNWKGYFIKQNPSSRSHTLLRSEQTHLRGRGEPQRLGLLQTTTLPLQSPRLEAGTLF